jgi:hypothetical protein
MRGRCRDKEVITDEADPESHERSPRMEPRSFLFLVEESTAMTEVLNCLIGSSEPAEDRKLTWNGESCRNAAAQGLSASAPSAASPRPGLGNLLQTRTGSWRKSEGKTSGW